GYWLQELPNDFRKARRDVSARYHEGGPGWGLATAWAGLCGAGECVWDIAAGGGCCVGGAAYSVVGPAYTWLRHPVTGILAALGPGAVFPGALYIWNGATWTWINGEAVFSGCEVGKESWGFYLLKDQHIEPGARGDRLLTVT